MPDARRAWIAREIRAHHRSAQRPGRLDGRPLAHHDVFVLTRTRQRGARDRREPCAPRASRTPSSRRTASSRPTRRARPPRRCSPPSRIPTTPRRRVAAWLTPFFGLPLEDVERARELPGDAPLRWRGSAGWKALADARDFGRLFESIVRESGIVRREIFFADGERDAHQHAPRARAAPRAGAPHARARCATSCTRCRASSTDAAAARPRGQRAAARERAARRADHDHPQGQGARGGRGLRRGRLVAAGAATRSASCLPRGGRRLAWVGSPRRRT